MEAAPLAGGRQGIVNGGALAYEGRSEAVTRERELSATTADTAPYYWIGNIAKSRVIGRVLADPRARLVVFDYGAGRGGDWPTILDRHHNIELHCFEPHGPSRQDLAQRLAGSRATIHPEIETVALAADVIVSFSVLEHVYDRPRYLAHAKRLLAPDGVFHLNYDDGHFRTALDLDRHQGFKVSIANYFQHRLAGLWPRIGRIGLYEARVPRAAADHMIAKAGFEIAAERYENLTSFKSLVKTLPEERRQAFTRLWLDVEERLNREFRVEGTEHLGDTANLWREMGSRTLELRHARGSSASG